MPQRQGDAAQDNEDEEEVKLPPFPWPIWSPRVPVHRRNNPAPTFLFTDSSLSSERDPPTAEHSNPTLESEVAAPGLTQAGFAGREP